MAMLLKNIDQTFVKSLKISIIAEKLFNNVDN